MEWGEKLGGQSECHAHGRPASTFDLSQSDSRYVDARRCEATLWQWLRGGRASSDGASLGSDIRGMPLGSRRAQSRQPLKRPKCAKAQQQRSMPRQERSTRRPKQRVDATRVSPRYEAVRMSARAALTQATLHISALPGGSELHETLHDLERVARRSIGRDPEYVHH